MKSLENKVALVTGGGSGIGRATSLLLSREGSKVIVADILFEAAKQVAEEIHREGGSAYGLMVDVTQRASVQRMIQEARSRSGQIDILVNIVGGSTPKSVLEMDESDWDRTLDLNLKSVFLCCSSVLGFMVERSYGKIVNLSSAQAFSGAPLRAAYAAAKGGVVGFTKSLALEVARLGISVNAVAPGLVATERVRAMHSEEEWQKAIASRPTGRAVSPEEVARVVLFLVQDGQSSITGQTIHVNGGALMW